jgi:hypothetical protein
MGPAEAELTAEDENGLAQAEGADAAEGAALGAGRRGRHRLRREVVEPVFGQIKGARGLRQFLLRSLGKVTHECALVCTAHNLMKLAKVAAA